MKRLISIFLALIMVFALAACAGKGGESIAASNNTEKESAKPTEATAAPSQSTAPTSAPGPEAPAVPAAPSESAVPVESALELGAVNTVENCCEFALRKIVTSDVISSSYVRLPQYKLYKQPELTYIDVVFDWTTLGDSFQYPYSVMAATAAAPDGTEYEGEVTVETPDEEGRPRIFLSILGEMPPEEHQVLHAIFQVAADIPSLSMQFTVGNHAYSCDYTLGDVVTSAKELKPGDVLESETATLEFFGIEYTDELVPASMGNGSYYYIHVQGLDEEVSTFLNAKFNLTSKQDTVLDSAYFLFMSAKYGDEFRTYYDSMQPSCAYYESIGSDGLPGFQSEIAPGETYAINYLITVSDDSLTKPLALFLEFDGREYVYREN